MSDCIYVKWVKGDSQGCTDRFALEDFAKEVSRGERVHLVLGPRGGRDHARFELTVKGTGAKLDYTKYKQFNKATECSLVSWNCRSRTPSEPSSAP